MFEAEWGEQHIELLEYREILNHWRELQKHYPNIRVSQAYDLWKSNRRDDFRKRIEAHDWVPNLVTSFIDVLPCTQMDLRLAALRHDIAYTKGGGKEEKLDADICIRADIIRAYPENIWAKVVANLVYWALQLPFSKKHFSWGPRAKGLTEYEHLLK